MAKHDSMKLGTVAGLAAAAAAAAAGAYWLYGAKDAAKNRKQVKGWMLKARGEVMESLEKLQDVDKGRYMAIVDNVLKRYKGLGVSASELAQMGSDLKASWVHMQAATSKGARVAKTGRKVTKRAAKKTGGK